MMVMSQMLDRMSYNDTYLENPKGVKISLMPLSLSFKILTSDSAMLELVKDNDNSDENE